MVSPCGQGGSGPAGEKVSGSGSHTFRCLRIRCNVYSNRREFTGKDRGPIEYQDVNDMTDEQIETELLRLWNKVQGQDGDGKEPKPTKH